MVRIILLVLAALVAILVAAVRYLPWWGILLTLAGEALALYLGFKFAFQRLLTAVFMIPFKAKGAVLKGATIEVHSIEAAEAPPALQDESPEDEDEDPKSESPRPPAPPRVYHRLDVTITPRPPTGRGFQFWEPGDLTLMPAKAEVSFESDDDNDDTADLAEVEVFQDGQFGPNEGTKYFGPQRLRILFGLAPGAPERLKFRYYFETFGEFTMPRASS